MTNRPDPRLQAAELRVDRFLERLGRLRVADLVSLSLSIDRDDTLRQVRTDALVDADITGLGDLANDALATVRHAVEQAYAGALYEPTMVGLNWGRSSGTVRDRVAVMTATEDAVLGEVVRDIVPPETYECLVEPFERLAGMNPYPGPTS